MKAAIVILNWNTKDYLRRFLPPLLDSVAMFNGGASNSDTDGSGSGSRRNDGEPHDWAEVVVADSASTDGSMEMMAREFPSVRRIPLEKNYGFTGGYNRALKELSASPSEGRGSESGATARGIPYDLFILLNSDIEVTRDWLRPLVRWMEEHPECGGCGPKLHSWYERDKFEYAGAAGGYIDRFGYPFCRGRVLGKVEKDSGQYDTPADVLWVTGACLAVRTEVWDALGGLDDRFFAHMEEIDLCWRMQLEGWRVTVVPESVVYHLGGGTLPQNSPQKLYLNYRNNLLLLDNNLARTIGCQRAALRIFCRKILDGCSAAVYLIGMKTDFFKAVWRAHRDAGKLIAGKRKTTEAMGGEAHWRKKHSVTGLYDGCMIPRALLGMRIRDREQRNKTQ